MSPTDRVFELLKERGLTAADAAKATGISQGNFTEWRKARNNPSYGALVKLAAYFNVSIGYLSGETDDPAPTVNYDDDLEYIGQKGRELPPEQRKAYMEMMKKFADEMIKFNKNK